MRHESPWDGLPVPPPGNLEARRADATHPKNFFYAKNAHGDFLLTLQVGCTVRSSDSLPRLRGVEVLWLPSHGRLQLRLCSPADRDMFAVLCRDLLAATSSSRSDEECVERMLGRLARWQRLLSRSQANLLNEEQIRGLVAELLFLRDQLIPRFGPSAVETWRGPQGFPQDFAIDGMAIEIKSHLVGSPAQVRISSPEQLFVAGSKLYLHVQRLAIASMDGLDLPSLIAEIAASLGGHATALASFELALAEAGYEAAPEYAAYRLSAEGADSYLVDGDFPRIRPQDVPEGACNLTYSIRLPALEKHRAIIDWHAQGRQQ